ncbi:SDR family oxidoreductase [Desulfatitalea alkaliphila]|uniref:SDR family oxidoreductase n=1 Tax=Desulfatitalea alkaliphila TaxID=2929485 RepID=A0AA41R5E4_9BACT|nr:SDR family oxidoreductase [Desulfatitalea alkaliphila]MCJ8501370.1 SDR family oxidoreductase [Desulfatitalea alkaliphila]
MSNNIKGKVVVITGASSGLGEATARFLSAQGASVVLGARRVERLQALTEELNQNGGNALAIATNVTDPDQVKRLVDAAVQTYGRIDVIINNAGLMPLSLLERLKVDDWNQMIDVNIKGVLYGISAALPYIKEQKSGHVINVSSVAGHKVSPGSAVYSATKHAVRVLSEGLRQEAKPYTTSERQSSRRVPSPPSCPVVSPSPTLPTIFVISTTSMQSRSIPLRRRSPLLCANRTRWISTRSCTGRRLRYCKWPAWIN